MTIKCAIGLAAAVTLAACAATFTPITVGTDQYAALQTRPADGRIVVPLGTTSVIVGTDQYAALQTCPADGRIVVPFGTTSVIECGYKPNEYAIAEDGNVIEVLGPEAYAQRLAAMLCPDVDAPLAECTESARRYVAERQMLKDQFSDQRAAQRAQDLAQRLGAMGEAMRDRPSGSQAYGASISGSRLGPTPATLTGFLRSQHMHGNLRTCVYSVGGNTAQRTIPVTELCPLSW